MSTLWRPCLSVCRRPAKTLAVAAALAISAPPMAAARAAKTDAALPLRLVCKAEIQKLEVHAGRKSLPVFLPARGSLSEKGLAPGRDGYFRWPGMLRGQTYLARGSQAWTDLQRAAWIPPNRRHVPDVVLFHGVVKFGRTISRLMVVTLGRGRPRTGHLRLYLYCIDPSRNRWSPGAVGVRTMDVCFPRFKAVRWYAGKPGAHKTVLRIPFCWNRRRGFLRIRLLRDHGIIEAWLGFSRNLFGTNAYFWNRQLSMAPAWSVKHDRGWIALRYLPTSPEANPASGRTLRGLIAACEKGTPGAGTAFRWRLPKNPPSTRAPVGPLAIKHQYAITKVFRPTKYNRLWNALMDWTDAIPGTLNRPLILLGAVKPAGSRHKRVMAVFLRSIRPSSLTFSLRLLRTKTDRFSAQFRYRGPITVHWKGAPIRRVRIGFGGTSRGGAILLGLSINKSPCLLKTILPKKPAENFGMHWIATNRNGRICKNVTVVGHDFPGGGFFGLEMASSLISWPGPAPAMKYPGKFQLGYGGPVCRLRLGRTPAFWRDHILLLGKLRIPPEPRPKIKSHLSADTIQVISMYPNRPRRLKLLKFTYPHPIWPDTGIPSLSAIRNGKTILICLRRDSGGKWRAPSKTLFAFMPYGWPVMPGRRGHKRFATAMHRVEQLRASLRHRHVTARPGS